MSQMEMDFSAKLPDQKRIMVFDLETRLSAAEVGGWHNKQLMRLAVGVVHDSLDGQFKFFYEEQAKDLVALLKQANLVVGYNSRNFDYAVLQKYADEPLGKLLPTLDILEELEKKLGFRVKLENVAQNTLGIGKSGDGLQSLQWVKEGKLNLVADYCRKDVEVTLAVFRHALDKRELKYSDKKGNPVPVKLDWDLEKFCGRPTA